MRYAKSIVQWCKTPLGLLLLATALFAVLFLIAYIDQQRTQFDTLQVGEQHFTLEVADTQASRELGLGKRASLPHDHGMLFVFAKSAPECFWMKDMHFPLDIIWANVNKQVTYIEPNVSPATYPESFCPSKPALYVIELNAGVAANAGMRVGETLDF
jgi:uncharacterized membrane protein (UPF0127 family)